MWNPIEYVSNWLATWLLVGLTMTSTLVSMKLQAIGRPLQTDAAPSGMLCLQFAWSPDRAKKIVKSWTPEAQHTTSPDAMEAALQSLKFDFVFLSLYSTTLALACFLAARGAAEAWSPRLVWLGWGQWGAGVLDIFENLFLMRVLKGPVVAPWPQLAALCSGAKFLFIIAGVLSIVFAAAWCVVHAKAH